MTIKSGRDEAGLKQCEAQTNQQERLKKFGHFSNRDGSNLRGQG
jgi:hypothetical protein